MEKSFLICALAVAAVGAAEDIRWRRVPNWLTYGAILSALTLKTFALGWPGFTSSLIGLFAGAAIPILLFALGGIGGGDVKLMGAVGAWVGFSQVLDVLAVAAVAAALAGLGLLAWRGHARTTLRNTVALVRHHANFGLMPHPELNLRESRSMRVPFAPAIAFGVLYSVGRTLFWG